MDILELIKKLEKMRNSTILPILLDDTRNIDNTFVSDIYELLESIKEKPKTLEIIIHSSGGFLDSAYHAATIVRNYCDNLNFIVPRWAKSAATLFVCGGNKIFMGITSELGPLDPQIFDRTRMVTYSPLSIKQTIQFLHDTEKEIRQRNGTKEPSPVIMRAVSSLPFMEIGDHLRMLNHVAEHLDELLKTGMFKEEYSKEKDKTEELIRNIITNLIEKHHYHGKCINYNKAKSIGLKAELLPLDQWNIIWEIFRIFEKEKLIKEEIE